MDTVISLAKVLCDACERASASLGDEKQSWQFRSRINLLYGTQFLHKIIIKRSKICKLHNEFPCFFKSNQVDNEESQQRLNW